LTDTDGLTSQDFEHVQVVNDPPTALITTPGMRTRDSVRTVNVSQEAEFSGFRSSDPNNDLLEFTWDFGDGVTTNGMNVTHSWANHGSYNVTLNITDGSMKDDKASDMVQIVVNSIPVGNIEEVTNLIVDEAYTFSANGTTDDDGDDLVYKWDLDGDGSFDQSGFNTTYTYSEEGEFEITLRVEDGFAWDEVKTVVNPIFPNEVPVPKLVEDYQLDEDGNIIVLLEDDSGEITLDASASFDPDDDFNGNEIIDDRERNNLTFYWDEDAGRDSSADSDNIKTNDFTKRSKTLRVTLENDNVFRVILNVTDQRGVSAYLTISLKGNHAPEITNALTDKGLNLYLNSTVRLQTTAEDPDGVSTKLNYKWTIGDDVKESEQPSYTYKFDEVGEFEILAEVSDGIFTSEFQFIVSVREFDGLSIKNPRENQIISGIVKFSGLVEYDTDYDIESISIRVDDGQWETTRKDANWEYELVTKNYQDGQRTLYVKVELDGGVEQISSINVEIKNSVESDNSGLVITIVIILVIGLIIGGLGYFLFGRKSNRTRDLMMNLPPPPGYGPGLPRMQQPGALPKPPQQSNLPATAAPPSEKKEEEKPKEDPGPKMIRIKCPVCKNLFKIEDTGERPLEMNCTHCGAKGSIPFVPGDDEEEEELGEEVEDKPEPLSIICPNCSGLFELDKVMENAKCPYCGVSGDLDEDTIEKLHEIYDEKEPEEMTVKCPSCQSKFSIKSTDTELICPFCGASGNVSK
jgi:uncharacterized CHY-type Zn-finger protein